MYVPFAGGGANALGDFLENVFRAGVENGVYRVQPQAVETELLDPIQRVVNHEIADGAAVRAIEVDGRAPRGFVSLREELRRVNGEVISIGAEVIVDHVQQDHQTALV